MNSSRIMGRFLVQNKWVKHTFIHWLTGTEKHPSLTFKPTTQSSLLFHATNKFNLVLSWKSNKCQKSAFWCHIHTLIEAIFQNKHKRKKLQLWQLEAEIWNCVSRLPLLQYIVGYVGWLGRKRLLKTLCIWFLFLDFIL